MLEHHLLAFGPEADGLDHLILLRHVQVLVLEKQFEVIFGQVADLGVRQQEREVLANKAKNLRVELLNFEFEGQFDAVVAKGCQVEVFHRVHLDWLLLRADHRVDLGWVRRGVFE